MSRSASILVSSLFLVFGGLAHAATWTVDAAGGGDFTTIQAAIDGAQPGDVLRVKPGTYASFTLGKDLAILGVPNAAGVKPVVNGIPTVQTAFPRLAGLRFRALVVQNVTGIALLDDLLVDGLLAPSQGCEWAMRVTDCNAVHMSRCEVNGKDGDFFCEGPGLRVENSFVTLTSSLVQGGTGWGDDFIAYDGLPALVVVGGARVVLAGSDAFGGHGGTPDILFGGQGGNGAPAIWMVADANPVVPRVTVRGSALNEIAGGLAGNGIGGQPAFTAVSGLAGTLTFSGAEHAPVTLAGPLITVNQPQPAEPFTTLNGDDLPNGFKRLNLHGPAGATSLLLVCTAPAQLTVPGVSGNLFVDPGTLLLTVPVPLNGQDAAVNLLFQLPPSLAGLENALLMVQAFGQGLGPNGSWFAENPTYLLLRGPP